MAEVTFKPSIVGKEKYNSIERNITSQDESLYALYINLRNRITFCGYGEMCEFVKTNITNLLTSAIDKKPRALQIITDEPFLIAIDLSNITLTREYINRFNRVYRSYVVNPSNNVIYNDRSANMLYKVAAKLNKRMIDILKTVGLTEQQAVWIIVNRYSSTDERRNIRRTVRAIQHMDPDIMTEQRVIDIFSKLFNDQLTNLFIAIMTDRFDEFENKDENYVYSTVSNALLDILNTMDEDEIMDIIKDYQEELNKSGTDGRFGMHSINGSDYNHICNAIAELESMGFYIS